jgi:hypothetical protein
VIGLIRDGVSPYHKFASPYHKFANEIQSIRHLLNIEHTFRKGNACADVLAKMGVSATSPLVIIDYPPPELSNALRADAWGVVFTRE